VNDSLSAIPKAAAEIPRQGAIGSRRIRSADQVAVTVRQSSGSAVSQAFRTMPHR